MKFRTEITKGSSYIVSSQTQLILIQTLAYYRKSSKYSDRKIGANSADQDQTAV